MLACCKSFNTAVLATLLAVSAISGMLGAARPVWSQTQLRMTPQMASQAAPAAPPNNPTFATNAALPLSLAQAQNALDVLTARLAGNSQAGRIRIVDIAACYPAYRLPDNVRVCAMTLLSPAGRKQTALLGLQKTAQAWVALSGEATVACASTQVVQTALQQMLRRSNVRVLQALLDGRGEYTNLRGQKRDKTGAWRLKCSYSVELQPGTEILLVTYLGYNGQQYTLENDFERWD